MSSIPRPIWTALIVVVILAVIPQVVPPLFSWLMADLEVVVEQVQQNSWKLILAALIIGAAIHLSPLHHHHGARMIEGAVLLLAVVLFGAPLIGWAQAHSANVTAVFTR